MEDPCFNRLKRVYVEQFPLLPMEIFNILKTDYSASAKLHYSSELHTK